MTAAKNGNSKSTSVLVPGFRWNKQNPVAQQALEILEWYKQSDPEFKEKGGAGMLFAQALIKFYSDGNKIIEIPSEARILSALSRIERNQTRTLKEILNALENLDMGSFVNAEGRSFKEEFDEHSPELIENVSSNLKGRAFNIDDEEDE